MPIPVGGQGNVDGEGGTENGTVHPGTMGSPWGLDGVHPDYRVRVRLEPVGLQPERSLRWTRTARLIRVGVSGPFVFATIVEPARSMDELSDDANDHGADDER